MSSPAVMASTARSPPPQRRSSLESHVHRKVPVWFSGKAARKSPSPVQSGYKTLPRGPTLGQYALGA